MRCFSPSACRKILFCSFFRLAKKDTFSGILRSRRLDCKKILFLSFFRLQQKNVSPIFNPARVWFAIFFFFHFLPLSATRNRRLDCKKTHFFFSFGYEGKKFTGIQPSRRLGCKKLFLFFLVENIFALFHSATMSTFVVLVGSRFNPKDWGVYFVLPSGFNPCRIGTKMVDIVAEWKKGNECFVVEREGKGISFNPNFCYVEGKGLNLIKHKPSSFWNHWSTRTESGVGETLFCKNKDCCLNFLVLIKTHFLEVAIGGI